MSSRSRSVFVFAGFMILAAGCGFGESANDDPTSPAAPVATLAGVGSIPAMPSGVRELVVVVRPPINIDGTEARPLGEIVDGNRILMIGDSILASTAARYGNHMCDAVEPLGWQVAVEAEPSRFIDFGNRVLDEQLPDDPSSGNGGSRGNGGTATDDDWDAALVFLGSNYGGDAERYEAELVEILDRLAPRPVLLVTVTEYRPNYVEVNEVVERLAAERNGVTVLDWRTISSAPGILSGDRLHPTNDGRQVLAQSVAAALGPFPDGVGECLESEFSNDSAVGRDSTKVLGPPATSSGSGRTTTSTTSPSATPTTTGNGTNTGTTTTTATATTSSPGAPTTTTRTPSAPTSPPTTATVTPTTAAPVAPTTAAPVPPTTAASLTPADP